MISNIIALLPLKANSERVVGKNFKELGGRPLFRWMLDTLLSMDEVQLVVINTDAREQLAAAGLVESARVRIRDRRAELCGDAVSMNRVLADDLAHVPPLLPSTAGDGDDRAPPPPLYLMTHVTNPFLSADTIRRAVAQLRAGQRAAADDGGPDSVFSVNRFQTRFYRADGSPVNHDPANLLRTQDLEPWFEENSCLYLFTAQSFAATGARIGRRPLLFQTPLIESIDIDTPEDWQLAEIIANNK